MGYKRRVKAKLREDRTDATQSNQVWAMDFVHDQLATGRKIRVLTVVDAFLRFSPVVDPRFSYRGEDVVVVLEGAYREVGYPKTIRVDQRSEFIPATSTCEPTKKVLNWTSPDRESQATMLYRIVQWKVPRGMPERALVPEP